MAIRSIVATRLSFNGPRMALLMKFGPPCPLVVTIRWFASAICLSSSARLRSTSAIAWSGTAPSSPRTEGHFTVGVASAPFPPGWPASLRGA